MNELIQIGPISPLRQRLIDDMTMRRFSKETQRNYLRDVGRCATWLGRSPHTASAEDIPGARNGSTPTPSSTQTAAGDETDSAQSENLPTADSGRSRSSSCRERAAFIYLRRHRATIGSSRALHITLDGLV